MIGGSYTDKYNNANSPDEKINYSYSIYKGEEFLEDFFAARKVILVAECVAPEIQGDSNTHSLFKEWKEKIIIDDLSFFDRLNLLLKRFEVTKKIYNDYDFNFRRLESSSFQDLTLYVYFSYLLVLSYRKTNKLQYLNTLLKVNDIVQSNYEGLEPKFREYASYCFKEEILIVEHLKNKK